jgi:uncharacterized repeat protein (TIGR01451 family)
MRSRRTSRLTVAFVAAALLAGPVIVTAATPAQPAGALLGAAPGLADVDTRTGSVAPTSAQRAAVAALGASATWNRFGTPASLVRYGGYLGTGLSGGAVTAARSWLRAHAALFRLTASGIDGLELVNDSPMRGSAGHAVILRQRFDGLPSAMDGLVTVGVVSGKVAYVSSSLAGTQTAPPSASLSASAAWVKGAANIGRTVAAGALSGLKVDSRTGWTVFRAPGFAQTQRVRPGALPLYTGGVRPVFEANVVDVKAGAALAYTQYVDAVTGKVLVRVNRVQESNQSETFTGSYSATGCGPLHPYTVDAATKSIDVVASAALPTNDIVLNLIFAGNVVAASDTGTSPEAVHYTGTGGVVAPGVYNVQVCPFATPTVPSEPPFSYAGAFVSSDVAVNAFPYPPQWKFFRAAPNLDYSNHTDTRLRACWVNKVGGTPVPGCQFQLANLASRAPWDQNVQTNTPSFTTLGNNATTAESWSSPLTPGAVGQRPVEADRTYFPTFTDQWNRSGCSPVSFTPAGNNNDVLAAVTNLFSGHNRFHDFSYFLGFTEENFNAQVNNFGLTAPGPFPAGRELDPEVGNVQAGALSGGQPSFLGRDNANQITLQDGVPPITNQYLFQPIAGAFYSPCVDGDYDTTVFGHEYTHLISNRMVAGPDSGLVGAQAGAMGESWSDQVALEYLQAYGFVPQDGENPWALGPYVTGNKQRGIRDYALNANPLNYSDIGFDVTGPEVHADGEVWNAVGYDLRQAFVNKFNGSFPASNKALQKACADGARPATLCPGNRRWIQLVFDAFLLQQSGTSMLDARDAFLAADVVRFNGANQALIWNVFAKRGMGQGASTATTEDDQPKPSFASPFANEATLNFSARDVTLPGRPSKPGKLYIGQYEARATPVADTDPSTALGSTVKLVPGTYDFVFRARGYGLRRFTLTFTAGQTVARVLHLSPNLASSANGATITGGGVNLGSLIDDTEATNWANLDVPTGVNVAKPSVTVKLAGTGPQMVRSVQVSALLRPESGSGADPDAQNRFTALRQFAIQTCVASVANANCALPTGFSTLYTSPANAFPGVAPRPLAPDLTLRTFDVPDRAATHVRLVALQNQCTGGPDFQGEQDSDPLNATDCDLASTEGTLVRASELQVYSFDAVTRPPGDPVVLTSMTAPATAARTTNITYAIGYRNLGPEASQHAAITNVLPAGVTFVSATGGGAYAAGSRTVRWALGTVPVGGTGTVRVTVKVTGAVGSVILNQASFTGDLTVGIPSAATTLVT